MKDCQLGVSPVNYSDSDQIQNTFHDFDSGKQRSFYTLRNWGGGGGGTCTKVTCMDPELFRAGGGGGSTARPVWVYSRWQQPQTRCFSLKIG